MIVFENVTKAIGAFREKRNILNGVSLQIPSDRRIAIVGSSMADKLALIDLLAGVTVPTSGRIVRKARVSYPAGPLGGFDLALPIRFNVAHVARLYDADVASTVEFVRIASRLGGAFEKPFGRLPKAERTQVAEIIAYSIPFDLYLPTADIARLQKPRKNELRAIELLEARARTCGVIVPSRDLDSAREFCDAAMVLDRGQLRLFEDIDSAELPSNRLQPS